MPRPASGAHRGPAARRGRRGTSEPKVVVFHPDDSPLYEVEPDRSEGEQAVQRGLSPWLARPGRRVATTLGLARGRATRPAEDDGTPGDDEVARALTGRQAEPPPKRRANAFRPLPRLGPRETVAKRLSFLAVACALSLAVAGVTAIASPTLNEVPAWLDRVPAIERLAGPAVAGAATLTIFLVALVPAGSFAATLAAAVGALVVVAGTTPAPAGVLATLGIAAMLGWMRRGRWLVGFVGGACLGVTAGWSDPAAWLLVLPLLAAIGTWPWRRPLVGLLRVLTPVAASMLALAAIYLLRFETMPASLEHARAVLASMRLTAVPAVPDFSPWLAVPALFGLAATLSRSMRAALFGTAWGGVAWVAATVPALPVLLAGSAAAVSAAGAGSASKFKGLWHPLAAGGLTAALLLAMGPHQLPDPAPAADRAALAAWVGDLLPDDARVAVPDDALALSLSERGISTVSPTEASADVLPYLLVPAMDRRGLERTLGLTPADRGEVLLRYYDQPTADATPGRQWVLVAPRLTPSTTRPQASP